MNLKSYKEFEENMLLESSSISEALIAIENSGIQVAFILSNKKKLIGLVTDGDIRRAIINGLSMDSSIKEIMNQQPIKASLNSTSGEIFQLMREHRVHQIPIVDDGNRIISVQVLDEFISIKKIPNELFILAGGKGSRLYPETKDCPKPMLLLDEKPILEHIIINAKNQGITKFIISINYLSHVIKDYFEDGEKLGVSITYVEENKPLGTAGSLSLYHKRSQAPLIIQNGDLISNINYIDLLDFHSGMKSSATMVVKKYEIQNPFGVVKANGTKFIGFEEKPIYKSIVNTGIYVINSQNIDLIIKMSTLTCQTFF